MEEIRPESSQEQPLPEELLSLHDTEVPGEEEGGEILSESKNRDHHLRRETCSRMPRNSQREHTLVTTSFGDVDQLLPESCDAADEPTEQ